MNFAEALTATASPDGKDDAIIWDPSLPGFGIRFRSVGGRVSKTWTCQYRVGGQQRRESLGDIRKISQADARRIARQRFAKVELGIDPGAEKAAKAKAQLTLAKVADKYLNAKQDTLRPATYTQAKYHFETLWKPIADRPMDDVGRAEVAARLQEIIKGHGRVAAARARGNLSALFTWAAKEGLSEANPVALTNDPSEGIRPRERVLSDDELFAIWNSCREDDFDLIVKLLALTGCRREEVGRLKWSEVNLDSGLMTIPGARTKNGRTLELPLPSLALNVLRMAKPGEGRECVFGRRGDSGFAGWAWGKLNLDHRITSNEGKALPHWTLHDLRRTMRTGLGRLDVPPHVAELCINHVKGGIQAVYDKYTYQPQIKDALERWANHVQTVTNR